MARAVWPLLLLGGLLAAVSLAWIAGGPAAAGRGAGGGDAGSAEWEIGRAHV